MSVTVPSRRGALLILGGGSAALRLARSLLLANIKAGQELEHVAT